jgi:hypothetical protein
MIDGLEGAMISISIIAPSGVDHEKTGHGSSAEG